MGLKEDFKAFLISGSLVAMAVAFVVGLAIVALIGALVADLINPLIGAALHVNFSQVGILDINNSLLMGGAFLGAVLNFLILMAVVFFLIVYPFQKYNERKKAREAAAPSTTQVCPYCASTVPLVATKCMYCTSAISGGATPSK
jgi:large conductance mechanosensitive channel